MKYCPDFFPFWCKHNWVLNVFTSLNNGLGKYHNQSNWIGIKYNVKWEDNTKTLLTLKKNGYKIQIIKVRTYTGTNEFGNFLYNLQSVFRPARWDNFKRMDGLHLPCLTGRLGQVEVMQGWQMAAGHPCSTIWGIRYSLLLFSAVTKHSRTQ